jgi:hypothetical protein
VRVPHSRLRHVPGGEMAMALAAAVAVAVALAVALAMAMAAALAVDVAVAVPSAGEGHFGSWAEVRFPPAGQLGHFPWEEANSNMEAAFSGDESHGSSNTRRRQALVCRDGSVRTRPSHVGPDH